MMPFNAIKMPESVQLRNNVVWNKDTKVALFLNRE